MTSPHDYVSRRKSVLKQLQDAAGIVFAGDGGEDFKAHPHFIYLTGITDEPGAAVVFDPSAENPARRIVLVLRPVNPELDRWDKLRQEIGNSLKKQYGFETILRTNHVPRLLSDAGRRTKKFACLMPLSIYPAAVSADLTAFRQVAERTPGVSIVDQSQLLMRMRAVKEKPELARIETAASATEKGYAKIVREIRPGLTERALCTSLERAFDDAGGQGVAYGSIVGTGINATVLHYTRLASTLESGELVLIDAAAAFEGYASDVTRTYPVSGKFTPDQRELYELVLEAMTASIKRIRPGIRMYELNQAAIDVFEKAGLADAFVHSIGHPLGLETHDVQPDMPLAAGMVITIEPGLYLADRAVGIRIEDDLLITRTGSKNLTDIIPKTVKAIEAAMTK